MIPSHKITGPRAFIGIRGKNLISFGSGEPDLLPPDRVYDVLKKFTTIRYGLIQGEKELREKLIKKGFVSKALSADNIVITTGGSEALNITLSTLPGGSKILLTKPHYYSYPKLAQFNHLDAVYSNLVGDHIDIGDLERKIGKADAVLVNSPANPTGMVETPAKIKAIQRLCEENGKLLIFDEVYSELIYEGEHYSPVGDNVICINSFSKTYNLCGARVGYCYSRNRGLIEDIILRKTHMSMNTSTISQSMASAALDAPKSFLRKNLERFRKRRDVIYKGLVELDLELHRPEGAFYALPKLSNPQQAVEELFYKYKIIVYNGEWFGAENRVRLSYALHTDTILEGLERIGKFLKKRK